MEEEIDLRPYIEAVIKHWYWIVGAAILAGVIAFIISSFLPPSYETSALVAVIPSNNVVQFDERFREAAENQPLRAFPQLAMSDQVMRDLLLTSVTEDITSVEDLRKQLEANAGDDDSILQLTAVSNNPQQAAALANNWAEVFVDWANDVYGKQSGEQVRFFEEQLIEAENELAEAEEALIEFQAVNRTQVLSNTLASNNQEQAVLLTSQSLASNLLQDVQYLRNQLATQPDTQPVTLADQLTALSLQLQTFNADAALPLELQVDIATSFTTDSRVEQLIMLDSLMTTLELQVDQTDNKLAELEPRILNLQQQFQEAETEYGRLLRNRLVAEETYNALARKVEEERITSADTTSGVRLASHANVPMKPAGTSRLLITLAAVFVGAIIGTILIFLMQWLKHNRA